MAGHVSNYAIVTPGVQQKNGFDLSPSGAALQTITYDKSTKKITVTPTGSTFSFYLQGVKFTKAGPQVSAAHGTTTGKYFFYYDSTGTLRTSAVETPWSIRDRTTAPVAIVYWDNSISDGLCFYECHTADRSLEQHFHDHFSEGTQYISGGGLTGYTLLTDSDAGITFAIGTTKVADEDIVRDLTAVADGGPYCVISRTGSGDDWTFDDTAVVPYKYATYPVYNNPNGGGAGVWGLTDVGASNFVVYYLVASTTVQANRQFFLIPDQAFTATLAAAQARSISQLVWGLVPFEEIAPLYKIIFRTGASYTSTGKARIEEVTSIIGTSAITILGSVASGVHNDLSGRTAADTHPASAITFTPYSTLAATNVQSAIQELLNESGGGPSGGVVPIGGIIMWSGTIATIPATWALCDGTANAPGPDLRDKFVVGASTDDAGVAKTNIAGSLSQTGGATGHSHSGHAALSHSGFSITDHTGLTHGLSIANHPDLTHAAIASHPALTLPGQTHADISLPGYAHPILTIEGMAHSNITIAGMAHAVLTIEGMSHAVQSIASRNDLVAAALTHADLSVPSSSQVVAAIAGKASFASGTNRSGMTSVPTNSGTQATFALTIVSHPTNSVTLPAWSISPASHPTFTASAPASHPTVTNAVPSHPTFTASAPASHAAATLTRASHPTLTASGLTHDTAPAHVGTDYGVHSFTAPPAHGTAGTVTHSFSESSAHALSAHDTVAQLPSYFALAFIQRMS